MIEGIVEPALLLLLCERCGHGYDLAAELQHGNLLPQPVPPARIYETLRRLERDGAVTSDLEASPFGPDRYRYTLAPTGQERLARWVVALRPTARSVRVMLDTYEARSKGVTSMSCNCCCGADERRNETDTSDAQLRAEREKQPLDERVAQLEAELQALRSATSKS